MLFFGRGLQRKRGGIVGGWTDYRTYIIHSSLIPFIAQVMEQWAYGMWAVRFVTVTAAVLMLSHVGGDELVPNASLLVCLVGFGETRRRLK